MSCRLDPELYRHEERRSPMSWIVEVDEEGTLRLGPETLGTVKPHTRYIVDAVGNTLVLRPVESQPFWESATPEERAEAFREWAASHVSGPGLPDEALRRENIYD
jgi:hypothetical protein